eukprot:2116250-Pleurochrysis_carterae.AAC.1
MRIRLRRFVGGWVRKCELIRVSHDRQLGKCTRQATRQVHAPGDSAGACARRLGRCMRQATRQ